MTRLEQLRKMVALQPDDAMLHYGIGLECVKLEQPDQAILAFERAIELDGKFSAAYYHKARTEIGAGRHDVARTTLTAGVEAAKAVDDSHLQEKMSELLKALA